jgi:hypothetical protein
MDAATSSVWHPEVLARPFVPSRTPAARATAPRSWRKVATFAWLAAALVAVLLLTVIAVSALRSLPPRGRIDADAYGRVRQGMDRAQVQTAVGLPPGDYRDRAHRPGGRAFTEWSEEAAAEEFDGVAADRLQWEGNEYSISAGFDDAGRLTWKTLWRHGSPPSRGPVDELHRRLGW